jgi:CheY-like chemotaxis protein
MIAIVDDDPEIVYALKTWMEMLGRATTVHGSGEQLLAWLQSNHNSADDLGNKNYPLNAAILDVNLPGINGIQLARKLRGKFPALPIVLVTALQQDEVHALGSLPLGVSFVRKPFDLDVIEDILFQSLN